MFATTPSRGLRRRLCSRPAYGKTMFAKAPSRGHRRRLCRLVRCGQQFCLETSIQGFSHVAAPGRHWVERLVWVVVLAASVWGMYGVCRGQWQRYRESPTVVTLEKDFRAWSFSLPAVTACAQDRVDPTKLEQAIKSRWNVSRGDERFAYYERFVRTVANSDLFHLEGHLEFDDEELEVDLMDLVLEVQVDPGVKASSPLSAPVRWVPAVTEAGVCHVANSLALADVALVKPGGNYSQRLPHSCRHAAASCYVMFEVFQNVDFYVHSPYDIPDMSNAPSRTYLTLNRLTELQVVETRAGAGVRALRPPRRRCRYTDEPDHPARQVYSTNTCRLACRSRLARTLCGCVPFYYFYDRPPCRAAGMRCLAARGALLAGARCSCALPCHDALYRELATDDQIWGRGPFQNKGSVRYTVQAPRARYTREIVFHFQDLVVSFGSAAGLFLGASFISFVEVLYFALHSCLRLLAEEEEPKKESRKPFETTRIQEINLIMERERILTI